MNHVVTTMNWKGGCGKTTTAVNLAHYLAKQGYWTLLVDLDSQANATTHLGLEPGDSLYNWLLPKGGKPLAEIVQPSGRKLLDVVASGPDTVFLEAEIGKAMFREQILSRALKGVRYDYTVIDCPPGWPDVSINALVAAHSVIIPVTLAKFGLDGLRAMMDAYTDFFENGHTRAKILAIIPTLFDRVTSDTQVQYGKLMEIVDPKRVTVPVPRDTKAKAAPGCGQTLYEYAPHAPAIIGYLKNQECVGGYDQAFRSITKWLAQERE